MGILDSLRGRRSRDEDHPEDHAADRTGGEIGPGDPAGPDPADFRPRTDGIYLSAAAALQFTGSLVREVAGVMEPAAARSALASPEARSGEYTPSGRFSVSAPFEMLVAYTVIDVGEDSFVARRTDANDRSTADLRYRFTPFPVPDDTSR